ncbi:MAG: divalent-cation tolerance protein CutA [Vicinamibacterales bacterium]
MTDCVLVWTTLGADADARTLAETLVNERLAACVTVQAPMDSVYRWRGSVEHERERQILIKTTTERVPALAARVRELHPYELPEFLVTPVVSGSEGYLAWLRESTRV